MTLSHSKEPTCDLISVDFVVLSFCLSGMESTGLPERNGVRLDFVEN